MERSRSRSGVCMYSSFVPSLLLLATASTSVSTLQVASSAVEDDRRGVLEHPIRGNVSCSSVCPPRKSKDNDIVFCRDNCPGYWNWIINVIFADPTKIVNQVNECSEYEFTHVPSNKVILCSSFRNLTNATERTKQFWSRNCISYFICEIRKNIDVLLLRSISSTMLLPPDSTYISFFGQTKLPFFIVPIALGVLCIALCGGLTAMIICCRSRNLAKQQENESREEAGLPLQPFTDQPPSPDNSPNDGASDEEDRIHAPVQEVGDSLHSSERSFTTPKNICSDSFPVSLHSVRFEETQKHYVDHLTHPGPPRAINTDANLME